MAEVSVKQMALTRNNAPGQFMERLQAIMIMVAGSVLSESASTPYHAQRAAYAQNVVRNPQMAAQQAGPQVAMGVNVINTTVYDEPSGTSSCTILDIDFQSQVMSLWNALAGIDTPT